MSLALHSDTKLPKTMWKKTKNVEKLGVIKRLSYIEIENRVKNFLVKYWLKVWTSIVCDTVTQATRHEKSFFSLGAENLSYN